MKGKLKTKLDFRFDVEDTLPDLNFLTSDPKEKRDERIIILKKNKRKTKKTNSELF